MLITDQNEIISLMPTAQWNRPSQLLGYLEEEERVALEPLLGSALYHHLCAAYKRLRSELIDITSTTVSPDGEARMGVDLPYADVTERLDALHSNIGFLIPYTGTIEDRSSISPEDLKTIVLLRYCQQIEFYRMLSHKAGMLTVSFNEGGGMNMASAAGYDAIDDKRLATVVKDAYMSANRSTEALLLFLEDDARSDRQFTDLWSEAASFYLHRDLLFSTARCLNEYVDIGNDRSAYVSLVRDIRYCQRTYLQPRVGLGFLRACVKYANDLDGEVKREGVPDPSAEGGGNDASDGEGSSSGSAVVNVDVMDETVDLLRTALAFFVEARREEVCGRKLARRDSMLDAQQSISAACNYISSHIGDYGDIIKGSPLYYEDDTAVADNNGRPAKNDAGRQDIRQGLRNKDLHLRRCCGGHGVDHDGDGGGLVESSAGRGIFLSFPLAERWLGEGKH